MAIIDTSVSNAVAKAKQAGGTLSYSAVQDIIRSVFDHGQITVHERDDLREVLTTMPMDSRAAVALANFLTHVDKLSTAADAKAKATGDKNQGIKVTIPDTGPFSEYDTDLGKFSHGNFDVMYIPGEGELWIILKVKYKFEKGITSSEQTAVKQRLAQAVQAWDNAGARLETGRFVLNPVIRIRFFLREVASGEHKTVDVEKGSRREWIGMDINVHKGTTVQTFIHELGHVYGNYDEYRGSGIGGWLERRAWWHDNDHLSDTSALMNAGTQFRARYFSHMRDFVNRKFVKVPAWYQAKV